MDLSKLATDRETTHFPQLAADDAPPARPRPAAATRRPMPVGPCRIDLAAMLHEALRRRAREIETRGAELRLRLAPAAVRSDPTLLLSLLLAVLEWGFEQARSRIDLTLERTPWPERAQLRAALAHWPADEAPPASAPTTGRGDPALDTPRWQRIVRNAERLGLTPQRQHADGRMTLVLDFPAAGADIVAGRAGDGTEATFSAPSDAPLLIGHQALMLASRQELRGLVRAALGPLRPMLDFAATVEQARDYCAGGLPHSLLYEGSLAGAAFDRLQAELRVRAPKMAFVRIVEPGRSFDLVQAGGCLLASVGRDAVLDALPAALQFELARLR